MSRKLTDDYLKWTLDVDGQPAQKALGTLEQRTRKLEQTNKSLSVSMDKLKAKGKENGDEYKRLDKQYKENQATIRQSKKRMEELRKEIGLNGLTAAQLRKRMRELKQQMDRTTPKTAEWKNLNKQLSQAKTRYSEINGAVRKGNAVFGEFKKLLPAIGIGMALNYGKQLVGNIIEVRKEFQKYEAVLTNTLGSEKEASRAMNDLQKFAKETPFQLSELTGAYVKLTNYGLQPTIEEMRKYGDIAASVGKSFDQFAEAEADAVTFQFERLKEFGIQAQKQGDKIQFTFKGVTQTVDANADSIKNYLVGLGDMQGVAGSMAAISGTLGGRISNLGDAWDSLMNTLGQQSQGVFTWVINRMIDLINMFDTASKSIAQIKEQVLDETVRNGMKNALQEIQIMENSLVRNGMKQQDAHKKAIELYYQSVDQTISNYKNQIDQAQGDEKTQLENKMNLLQQERDAVENHYVKLAEIEKRKNKELTDSQIKSRVKLLEAGYNRELALINKRHLDGKISEDQYNADLLQAELNFLNEKLKVYKKGSKEYEQAMKEATSKQVQVDKTIKDQLLKAETELSKAKINNLSDGLNKELALENERWTEEKTALEKRLINKENLSEKELKLNETINKLIEEGEQKHQKNMDDIKSGKKVSDAQNIVNSLAPLDPNYATQDQQEEYFAARQALIEAQYEKEKQMAGDNQSAMLAAERNYQRNMLQLKYDQIDAEYKTTEDRIKAGRSYLSALESMVDEESGLGKALFLFNQALAISEVWVNIAKANAKAIAASPLTAGQPWVTINTIQGGVQTAMIAAQTVAKFVKPQKSNSTEGANKSRNGYWTGGYTGDGNPADVAGPVHRGEWVANSRLLQDATAAPVVAWLDQYQRSMPLPNLPKQGFASGGYTSAPQTPAPIQSDPEMKALIAKNNELMQSLRDNPIIAHIALMDGSNKTISNLAAGNDELARISKNISK